MAGKHELSPERTAEAERWRSIISGYIGGLTLHENPGTYCADLDTQEVKS